MKKLKLKALELGSSEMLTREQLKNVLGGGGSGSLCSTLPSTCYPNACVPQGPCSTGMGRCGLTSDISPQCTCMCVI